MNDLTPNVQGWHDESMTLFELRRRAEPALFFRSDRYDWLFCMLE